MAASGAEGRLRSLYTSMRLPRTEAACASLGVRYASGAEGWAAAAPYSQAGPSPPSRSAAVEEFSLLPVEDAGGASAALSADDEAVWSAYLRLRRAWKKEAAGTWFDTADHLLPDSLIPATPHFARQATSSQARALTPSRAHTTLQTAPPGSDPAAATIPTTTHSCW